VALRREPPERGTWHWGWLALATVSLILAAAFFQDYYRVGQQPARDIVVRAVDAGGQLVISWDRGAELARWARRAVLDVTDGGNRSSFNLDADRVARGTLTYQRRSGEVDVRMRVFGPEGRAIEGLAAFIGQPASAPAAPEAAPPKQPEPDPSEDLKRQLDAAIRERDAALEEAGRLRTAVANQARRNRELEDAIEALRRRLRVESGLRGR
jgi:hypothetical protein